MTDRLAALRMSTDHLRALAAGLDADALRRPAYPTDWTVADVLSHLGSSAQILLRRFDAAVHDRADAPDEDAIWAAWDAKSPDATAADALVADAALLDAFETLPHRRARRLPRVARAARGRLRRLRGSATQRAPPAHLGHRGRRGPGRHAAPRTGPVRHRLPGDDRAVDRTLRRVRLDPRAHRRPAPGPHRDARSRHGHAYTLAGRDPTRPRAPGRGLRPPGVRTTRSGPHASGERRRCGRATARRPSRP